MSAPAPGARRSQPVATRLGELALRLYPLTYRRRYGDEMRALLDDCPPRPSAVLDLLRGALRAHLRPARGPAGAVDAADRVRASASGVLLCWVFFAAAGFGFYKTTEDYPFSAAGQAHPLLRDAHLAVQVIAVLASAAVVFGALPLIAAAVAQARRDPAVRRPIVLAFLPLIVFAGVTAVVIAIAHAGAAHRGIAVGYGLAILWGITGLSAGVTCALACRAALFATPASAPRLRVALAAGTLVTIAMLAIAIATAIYAIALARDAAQLAGDPNGPFGLLSVAISLILQVIVMTVAGALAVTTTVRGWHAEGYASLTGEKRPRS